jgi:Ca2+-transporting ATPase
VARQIAAIGSLIAGMALVTGAVAMAAGADVRSGVFATLGLGQLAVALGLRARVGRRRLGQRGLEVAVLGALALQVLAVYLPALNELLGTEPLPLPVLATAFALAVVPGVAVRLLVRAG